MDEILCGRCQNPIEGGICAKCAPPAPAAAPVTPPAAPAATIRNEADAARHLRECLRKFQEQGE